MDSPTKTRKLTRHSAILASLSLVLLAGCSESVPTGTVGGKVLLNDSPYTDASVVFVSPQTGAGGSADIQPDGTFQLKTPLQVGSYTVFLAPKSSTAEAGEGGEQPVPVSIDASVPDKYWNEATSDIKKEIVEGQNDVTVNLSK